MGIGEFLSLLCAFLWAIAVIFYKRAGDHFNAYEMNLFNQTKNFIKAVDLIAKQQ